MNHVTVGVYGNESFVVNIVRDEDLKNHIEYNRIMRPGRILFVDGKYECGGVLKEEFKKKRINKWEEKIKDMDFDTSRSTEPYS